MMGNTVMQREGVSTDLYVVLIGNLPWKCKWQDLKDLARNYTKSIERAEIYLTPDGRSRGFGYVRVRGRDEALKVLSALDGHEWEGRALMVKLGNEHDVCPTAAGHSQVFPMSTPPLPPSPSRKSSLQSSLSMSQYGVDTTNPPTDGECWPWIGYPDDYGVIRNQQMPYHDTVYLPQVPPPPLPQFPATNCFRPPHYGLSSVIQYGYTRMAGPERYPVFIDHSQVWVPPSPGYVTSLQGGLPINLSSGAVMTEPRGIFVGNLPYDISWRELRDHLGDAGSIVRCDVPKGSNGKGKGYGTVLFKSAEEAERAVDLFNGSILKGRPMRVRRDKFATRKENIE